MFKKRLSEIFNTMNLSQKIIFSVWLLLASFIIMTIFSVEQGEQDGFIPGLIFISVVFWILFKVWADKKI